MTDTLVQDTKGFKSWVLRHKVWSAVIAVLVFCAVSSGISAAVNPQHNGSSGSSAPTGNSGSNGVSPSASCGWDNGWAGNGPTLPPCTNSSWMDGDTAGLTLANENPSRWPGGISPQLACPAYYAWYQGQNLDVGDNQGNWVNGCVYAVETDNGN